MQAVGGMHGADVRYQAHTIERMPEYLYEGTSLESACDAARAGSLVPPRKTIVIHVANNGDFVPVMEYGNGQATMAYVYDNRCGTTNAAIRKAEGVTK